MAFTIAADKFYFQPIGGQSGRGASGNRGAPAMWSYKTQDAHAVVDGSGYFNAVSGMLRPGDLVLVVVVTNRGASNEAVATIGWQVVLTNAAGVVDTSNVTVIAVTDSD